MNENNLKVETSTVVKLPVSRSALLAAYEVIIRVHSTISTVYQDDPVDSDKFIIDNCKIFLSEVEEHFC